MLFAGNILCQPAYKEKRHKVISELTNTNYVMNNGFWIGVYAGIDKQRIDYVIKIFKNFLNKFH